MSFSIFPSSLRGHLAAIPSKSHLHRLLICAALADGETILRSCQTNAEDITATISCLTALGAKITRRASEMYVQPIDFKKLPESCVLPCFESGSTLRFMLPIVCALGVNGTFQMAGRLPERPLAPLDSELTKHGITLSRPAKNVLCTKGRLISGDYQLPGNVSSQYITGLLFALPLVDGSSTLVVTEPIESEDYITLTLQVLAEFGQEHNASPYIFSENKKFKSPGMIETEGDWSNAAFWLCAGAMPGGNISLSGLNPNSTQGDKAICDILKQMGAQIEWLPDGTLCVKEGKRRGVEIDARAIPDLVPVLAAVAAVGDGVTVFKNAARLRIKESDRLMATAETLNRLGAKVAEEDDGLTVEGVAQLWGGTCDSFGDHRIAMMAAIASTACENPVNITGADAVNKSYPKFWEDFSKLGKEVKS